MSAVTHPPRTLRVEVQALRAAAVLAVIGFHFWPGRLPGGYLGVDIFFVISGFLITAHLLGELESRGRVSFAAFYARRARRILPSALVVLAACLAVTLALASVLNWQNIIGQIIASALFVQNWYLALASVDYLGATADATLVQHYWSLSVEEQFYLVWPALIAGLFVLAGRSAVARGRLFLIVGLAVIVVVSLGYWLWLGTTDPTAGFFNTGARAWQFAAGGLLATIGTVRLGGSRSRFVVGMLGWIVLGASMVFVLASTLFTAVIAIVAVVGTVLVIAAGVDDAPSWWSRALASRPIRFVAEVSFAAYLWHWPVLIVAEELSSDPLSTPVRLGLIVVTLALAWATTRWVENPVRFGRVSREASARTVLAGAVVAIALVVIPATTTLIAVDRVIAVTTASANDTPSDTNPELCVGAEARDPNAPCIDGPYPSLTPNPLADRGSISVLHDIGCATTRNVSGFASCEFGDVESEISVALIGDSKAMKMYPAIERLALEHGWRMVTFLKGACAFRDAPSSDATCTEFRERLAGELSVDGHWDLVITLGATADGGFDDADVDEIRAAWAPIIANDVPIVVIRDNPFVGNASRECVLDNLDDVHVCDVERGPALRPDAQVAATRGLDGTRSIDLTDVYCDDEICPVAIGGILVYRDASHVNDEFTYTLAPYIEQRLRSFVPQLFENR